MIHGHGDDIQGELTANFSSNVWYDADNSALFEHLCSVMNSVSRYPEPDAASLSTKIACESDINSSQVLITNGSNEAFYLISNTFNSVKSLIASPTFSEYADACQLYKHQVIECERNNIETYLSKEKPKLFWLCNPNNPDGFFCTVDCLKEWLKAYPETIFVIDQAYAEFTTQEVLAPADTTCYTNLILTFSMTKQYAIPGLRLGYLVACEQLINQIRPFCIPWNVNTLAIEAGKFLLDKKPFINLECWLACSQELQNIIQSVEGYEITPSSTPFFLVRLKRGKSSDLKEFLMKKRILIRDASNFNGLNEQYIRICTQSAENNKLLISELIRWMKLQA